MAEIDKGLPSNTRTEIDIPTEEEIKKLFAEGGGVKSGPPPESGPTPHGLPSLMKRGMKI